jgi:hypothetical protein
MKIGDMIQYAPWKRVQGLLRDPDDNTHLGLIISGPKTLAGVRGRRMELQWRIFWMDSNKDGWWDETSLEVVA